MIITAGSKVHLTIIIAIDYNFNSNIYFSNINFVWYFQPLMISNVWFIFRDAYQKVKNRKVGRELREFSFSEKYIFGRFDAFCVRLKNLLGIFCLN